MECRENHAAVTFAADDATVFDHLEAHVDFTDLRAAEFATVLGGNIFVHAARGEVHANATLLLGKHFIRRNRKRVFFTDTLSQTIDESAAVCIRVHGKANCAAVILDSLAQVTEIFRNRFCTARECAIRAAMNADNFATELFQKTRHDKATGTVHGIDSDLEMLGLDGFDIHERNLERAVDVDTVGIRSDFVLAHRAVIRIAELVGVSESEELLHVIRAKEKSLVVEELESIPFERVMACGNDDARISLEVRRQKFHGRGRRKAHIHNIHARKAANASDELHNRITCGAAITANHHALCLRDFEESTHMALQNLRSKGIANDSADTRNRTH